MSQVASLLIAQGTPIVFAATLAARIGVPVPAAPFVVVAGALAATGHLSWLAVLLAAVVAGNLGDALWFWAGRRHGYKVLKLLCRISMSPDSCVRESEAIILRWGGLSLIAAKFVPGVSVVAPPMAGALGMSLLAFVAFDTLAGAIWAGLFLGIGWVFASQVQQVLDLLSTLGTVASGVLVVVAAAYLGLRYGRRRWFRASLALPRVGVDELRSLIDAGAAPLIVDVRSGAARQLDRRRLPGAVAVELGAIEGWAEDLPRDGELVLYCNCPNEASAARAARLLVAKGFTRVRALTGGIDGWVASGHDIEFHEPNGPRPAMAESGD